MNDNQFGLGPKQGPDAKQLLLAGVLITAFVMVYNYFFPPTPMPKPEKETAVQVEKAQVAAPTQVAAAPIVVPVRDDIPVVNQSFTADVKSHIEQSLVPFVRGGYQAFVTNEGGQVEDFSLSGYETPIRLAGPLEKGVGLFALRSADANLTLSVNDRYQVVSSDANHMVMQRTTREGVRVVRQYTFQDTNFTLQQKIKFHNETASDRVIQVEVLMETPLHEEGESSFFSAPTDQISAMCKTDQKRSMVASKDIEEGSKAFAGQIGYAGFDERYFLTALMPQGGTQFHTCQVSKWPADAAVKHHGMLVTLGQTPVTLKAGGVHSIELQAYMGPKQLGLLKAVSPQLEENVNFGWFTVISRPMLWLLVKINEFVHNFGIAIILLTLILKLLTFPLTQKSYVSMQQMKVIAPELKVLQEKYAQDRSVLAQKQMELYKQKGVNPMAGCLPMLVQLPIWMALYQMLGNSVELYQQPFFGWLKDLTQPDPYLITPLVMGATMLIQTAFQPTPADQPQMKYMFWFMPIFFTFVTLKMPSGLTLYMFVNNILTIFQQLYIKRRYGSAST